ncbi:unnamed protein product [Citrullus colocynthis]|uniref:Uncharacterized protein n=1 Tax=Citrullus colocynthis TaxID=252529 RepID=A0ABP0Z112_9ROSI
MGIGERGNVADESETTPFCIRKGPTLFNAIEGQSTRHPFPMVKGPFFPSPSLVFHSEPISRFVSAKLSGFILVLKSSNLIFNPVCM